MNKKDARNLIKERRMNLSMEYIESASDKIFEKLLENEDFKNAKVIMSYMDFKNEVKTDKINENKYIVSPFGNSEPDGEEYIGEIDVIITPGVAFDRDKNRVGFGRGYYDRFFAIHKNAKKIAIAFEKQIIEEGIEITEFDMKVDTLITEDNIIK